MNILANRALCICIRSTIFSQRKMWETGLKCQKMENSDNKMKQTTIVTKIYHFHQIFYLHEQKQSTCILVAVVDKVNNANPNAMKSRDIFLKISILKQFQIQFKASFFFDFYVSNCSQNNIRVSNFRMLRHAKSTILCPKSNRKLRLLWFQ